MDATLSLLCEDMTEHDVQEMTFEMMRTLNQETELEVEVPEETGGAGTKGDPVAIGQILLAALSSGTVVAMFNVLKSYIDRKPSLKLEIQSADGRKMKIEAEHLKKEQIDQTIQMAKAFCGSPA
jgi:hypothetical protein